MKILDISAFFVLPALASYLILISFDCYEASKMKIYKNHRWFKYLSLGMAIYFLILSSYIIKLFFCWHY